MATREQLVERVADIMMPLYIEEWRPPSDVDYAIAEHILDAVLPQVTTVEELEALPAGTKLLGRTGEVWWRRTSRTSPWQGSGGGFGATFEPLAAIHARFLSYEAPLTVVWRP